MPNITAKGAIHQTSQQLSDWQICCIGPFLLSEGSKYALVCMDTVSGLTYSVSCYHANQAATIRIKRGEYHVQVLSLTTQ